MPRQHHRVTGTLLAATLAGIPLLPVTATAAPTSDGTAEIFTFADQADGSLDTPVGTSTLARDKSGISATFRTGQLRAHHAYTLWIVVFNRPENCAQPCNEDDIFVGGDPRGPMNTATIKAADIHAVYGGGKVADASGTTRIDTHLPVRDASREDLLAKVNPGAALKETQGAEVHLVLRSHGPKISGQVEEQLGSYAGGCTTFLHPPAVPKNEGECADLQFAVHPPQARAAR
ncbi:MULTISPECIES: hypothetical protein [Streptomyces]|uniref:hypothetical protein n=1 Tax=Streptomyces TaxID=1883 RepID=UPI0015DAD240|nr:MULTISPECIES: hypothetical protein [Streptomyces]